MIMTVGLTVSKTDRGQRSEGSGHMKYTITKSTTSVYTTEHE